jgi:mannose-1-phosphate guanylyltransferase
VIDRIAEGRRVSIERETFPALVADRSLYARSDDAYWIDVGTPERYLQVNLDYNDGCGWTDPTAKIEAGATVHDSVLLAGATVQRGATVERSIVGRRSTIGAGASLSELCVIGDDVRIGPGAALAGARVPESG